MVSYSVSSSSCMQAYFTRALIFTMFISSTAIAAQAQIDSQLHAKPTPFPVCIDDSDCLKMGEGNKYACFQYLCYPWKDDTHVAPKDRRKTCRSSSDCEPQQQCFRHHDKRNVFRGICFDEVQSCDSPRDCPKDYGCCGGNCCEESYYRVFTGLPCISHMGCQDLGLGKYCCPQNGNETQSVCCNIDPNPPPTTPYPEPASAIGGATTVTPLVSLTLSALYMVYNLLSQSH